MPGAAVGVLLWLARCTGGGSERLKLHNAGFEVCAAIKKTTANNAINFKHPYFSNVPF